MKIIMPDIPDKPYAFALAKTYYPELIRAGVKIYQYVPGFVHAKVFTSDNNEGSGGYDQSGLSKPVPAFRVALL